MRHLSHSRRVLHAVTPYGRQGPSSRVRVYEWLDRIAEPCVVSGYIGHHNASPSELVCHPVAVVGAELRLRRLAAQRPRRLLLHRESSPLSRGSLERRLLSSAEFSVYDFDDGLQWDWGATRVRRIAPKAPKALAAVSAADRVVAGNAVLADWAADHNRDVIVIPSCVAPECYRLKVDYALADPPRLAWLGTASSQEYFDIAADALREVHRQTGARLTLIGPLRPTLGDLEHFIDRVPWSESTQFERLAEFDLCVAPTADEPYARGKCGYKLLQYAAAGAPMVGSPVGVNREILQRTGMPAPERPCDWTDAILELLSMPADARASLGTRAREVTERCYSFATWLPRWRAAMGLVS
jgi:glycosyltransferase involved in cell wall biosynthesis